MIKLDHIVKRFDNKLVINHLDLVVEKGERVAIIGPSGCGKSTILRLILGLLTLDAGKVLVKGEDITQMSTEELEKMRHSVGLLFQSSALFDSMSVKENVAFSLREAKEPPSESEIDRIVQENLAMVDMEGNESMMPSQLSGGQKKRVGLARSLAKKPEMMLYDEPTTGLDPQLSTSIENLIVKLSDELSVTSIVVTHQHSTMLRTADKIYFMDNGILLPYETPDSIKETKQPKVSAFFKGKITNG